VRYIRVTTDQLGNPEIAEVSADERVLILLINHQATDFGASWGR